MANFFTGKPQQDSSIHAEFRLTCLRLGNKGPPFSRHLDRPIFFARQKFAKQIISELALNTLVNKLSCTIRKSDVVRAQRTQEKQPVVHNCYRKFGTKWHINSTERRRYLYVVCAGLSHKSITSGTPRAQKWAQLAPGALLNQKNKRDFYDTARIIKQALVHFALPIQQPTAASNRRKNLAATHSLVLNHSEGFREEP